METETELPAPIDRDESRGGVFLFAAAGLAIYVVLRTLDPLIAFPLRQISSTVATYLLNALSVPCTLSGTVISTTNFVFDVNPDCSGSTSLRIMLTLGALWFGMYPNLTLVRRILSLALAAPIAVFFNAVRVTALVVMGDARGTPVAGFPHELVGIATFGLAMGVVYLLTLLMAREPSVRKRTGPGAHVVLLVGALALCYLPLLWTAIFLNASWLVGAIKLGMIAAGLGFLVADAKARPVKADVPGWISCGLFAGSLLVLAGGTMSAVVTLTSLSLLGVIFALLLFLRGWSGAFAQVPLLGVFFLGLPHMGHYPFLKIADLLGPTESRQILASLMEVPLAGGVLAWHVLRSRRGAAGSATDRSGQSATTARLTAAPMKFLILAAVLGVVFQTVFNSGAADFDQRYQLLIPDTVGEWSGTNMQPSDLELQAYGSDGIVSRIYRRPGAEEIMLLVSSSGGKRHATHDPRYCMTVGGWNVQEEEKVEFAGPAGPFAMMKLLLERNGELLEMRYWYDSDQGTTALTARELFVADVARRLAGQRPDWRVYRVFGRPGSAAIEQFIEALVE